MGRRPRSSVEEVAEAPFAPDPTRRESRRRRSEPKQSQLPPIDLSYLARVRETGQALSSRSPIWLRHGVVREGPAAPTPERHRYCEFGIQIEGSGIEWVGAQKTERRAGDLLLAGPGVPHWIEVSEYPLRFITVFFIPQLLLELAPELDGPRMLRRFTGAGEIGRRLVRPKEPLRRYLVGGFEQMVEEFETTGFGRESRLRVLLVEMLVRLIRWEDQAFGGPVPESRASEEAETTLADWRKLDAALEFLRANHAQAIYSRDVAQAIGVSESKLKALFRTVIGLSWGKYLQAYRIHQASALLATDECGVLDAALAVGFDTMSHFNATFQAFLGVSPREYRQRVKKGLWPRGPSSADSPPAR